MRAYPWGSVHPPSGGKIEFIAQRNLSEPAKFLSFHAKRQRPRSLWQMKRLPVPIIGRGPSPPAASLAVKPVAVSRPCGGISSKKMRRSPTRGQSRRSGHEQTDRRDARALPPFLRKNLPDDRLDLVAGGRTGGPPRAHTKPPMYFFERQTIRSRSRWRSLVKMKIFQKPLKRFSDVIEHCGKLVRCEECPGVKSACIALFKAFHEGKSTYWNRPPIEKYHER